MSDLNLRYVKERALTLLKNNAPDPGKVEHFLTECWIEAVVSELQDKNLIDVTIKRDHVHMIKE